MVTSKEFLDIFEHHLVLQTDGSILLRINDPELAKKYKEFISKFAKPDMLARDIEINLLCHIVIL